MSVPAVTGKNATGKKPVCLPEGNPRHRCGVFSVFYNLDDRQQHLLGRMARYFTEDLIRKYLIPVSEQEHAVSLRLLDFSCKNYAQQIQLCLSQADRPPIDVYADYSSMLSQYHKVGFGAFRRHNRTYYHLDGKVYETTLAQLNFLWWARQIGMFSYVTTNREALEKIMSVTYNKHNASKRKKREMQGMQATDKMKRQALMHMPARTGFSVVQHKAPLSLHSVSAANDNDDKDKQ